MRIASVRDLALYLRDRRQQLGLTQEQLANSAGVSRRWLSNLEAGKPTAELGLVLRAIDALGLTFDLRPELDSDDSVSLDELLRRHGPPRHDES